MIVLSTVLAAAAHITAGTYIMPEGTGEIRITEDKGEAVTFAIEARGANGHSCSSKGTLAKGMTTFTETSGTHTCKITLTPGDKGLTVELVTPDCHATYCGMRASMDGEYVRAPNECLGKEVAATQRRGQGHYQAKKWSKAKDTFVPLLKTCAGLLDQQTEGSIRNDLAVTYHKLEDKASCLEALAPLAALRALPENEFEGLPPADARAMKKLWSATNVNYRLCSKMK